MPDDKTTLRDLKERVREEVRDTNFEEYDYPRDILHEIADSAIPVYNSNVLDVAKSDLWLAVEEPEFWPRHQKSAISAIQANIYNELSQVAHEEFDKQKEKLDKEV